MSGVSQVTVRRQDTPGYSWTTADKPVPEALAPFLTYCGYEERPAERMQRREVPIARVVMILCLGEKLEVREVTNSPFPAPGTVGSFVAGLGDGSVVIENGEQEGIQLDLTPLGAYRLLGLPMKELTNQVVELEDVRGAAAVELVDRLASTPGWDDRFALLDDELTRWAADGPDPDPAVAWAWNQLDATSGSVEIGALADETGWSRRHFIKMFRDQVGLAPKATAQVLRFNQARQLLAERRAGTSITDVAMACGYADHSHLIREFKRLSGSTPSAWLAQQLAETFGVDPD